MSASVKLSEGELREALGVSKVSLWHWRRQGMPALSQGRRGVENEYDAHAVIGWLRAHAERDGTVRGYRLLDQVRALSLRLGLSKSSAVVASSAPSAPPVAAVHTCAERPAAGDPVLRAVGEACGVALANSLIPTCGLFAYRLGIAPERALELFEDFVMFFMAAAGSALALENLEILFCRELEQSLSDAGRADLAVRIGKMAAEIAEAPESWPARWTDGASKP